MKFVGSSTTFFVILTLKIGNHGSKPIKPFNFYEGKHLNELCAYLSIKFQVMYAEFVLQTLRDCKPLKYVVVRSKHLLRIGNHGNI